MRSAEGLALHARPPSRRRSHAPPRSRNQSVTITLILLATGVRTATGAGPAAPAACGAPGYTCHAGCAIAGGDIRRSRAADPARLARECDQTPGCVAFTSGGWLKSRAAPLAAGAGGAPEGGGACQGVFVSDDPEAQQRRWRGSQQLGTEAVAQLHAATRRAAARRRLLQEAAPASAHSAEAGAAAAGATVPLPRRWSARSHASTGSGNWVSPPKHQGSCGACSVFATTAAAETALASKLHPRGTNLTNYLDLSEQEIYFCHDSRGSCGGYWDLVNAVANLLDYGVVSEQCLPYSEPPRGAPPACARREGCQVLPPGVWDAVVLNTTHQVKQHITRWGAVLTGMYIREELWRAWGSGQPSVYRAAAPKGSRHMGGHGIMVYGYDDNGRFWRAKNSWGRTGGTYFSGTFKLSYDEEDVMGGNWPTIGLVWHPLPAGHQQAAQAAGSSSTGQGAS